MSLYISQSNTGKLRTFIYGDSQVSQSYFPLPHGNIKSEVGCFRRIRGIVLFLQPRKLSQTNHSGLILFFLTSVFNKVYKVVISNGICEVYSLKAVSGVMVRAPLWDLKRSYWINLGVQRVSEQQRLDNRTNTHTFSVSSTHLASRFPIVRAHVFPQILHTIRFFILRNRVTMSLPFYPIVNHLLIIIFLCHFLFCFRQDLIMNSKLTFNSLSCFSTSSTTISGRCHYL